MLSSVPDGRPAIPAELKRRVLMEAGHRCAIPTCRTVPVEIAHIEPYSEVRGHNFENLIVLCPTCHTRYDNGDIDRLSMKGYKANLGLVSGRYGEIERRLLDALALEPTVTHLRLPGGLDFQVMYLLKDGLIAKAPRRGANMFIDGWPVTEEYIVTAAGRQFIERWVKAEPVTADVELTGEPADP
jgi:hypothetical protein